MPGKGRFALRLRTKTDYIDLELKLRNDSDRFLPWVDWYFCPVVYEAPSLLNRRLDRTHLFDGKRLVTLLETGDASETMYPVAGSRGSGGFIPPLHGSLPRSKFVARAPLVVVENQARTHTMGLAFERAHSLFSSVINGCYHANPYFGPNLEPGEERTVRGRLYLAKGRAADLLQRYQQDFPADPP